MRVCLLVCVSVLQVTKQANEWQEERQNSGGGNGSHSTGTICVRACVCACLCDCYCLLLQVVFNVEEVCQLPPVCLQRSGSQPSAALPLRLSVLLSLSFLFSLPNFSPCLHGQRCVSVCVCVEGGGAAVAAAAAAGGGDLSVMGRRVIVVELLSHANAPPGDAKHKSTHISV